MAIAKKIGEYEGTFLYREPDGSVWASGFDEGANLNPDGSSEVACLVSGSDGETVEGFIEALRAATADPLSRLLDACEAFIDGDARDSGTPNYCELMAAYDNILADIASEEDADDAEE